MLALQRVAWACFFISVLLVLLGALDLYSMRTGGQATSFVRQVAPGTYWKGAMVLTGWSIALALLAGMKSERR